jgi:hypothetical protein
MTTEERKIGGRTTEEVTKECEMKNKRWGEENQGGHKTRKKSHFFVGIKKRTRASKPNHFEPVPLAR